MAVEAGDLTLSPSTATDDDRPAPVGAFSIVCLSSQEWNAALPTNRQQIMARAAERGHEVLFVETGGFLGLHLLRLLRGPGRRSTARRLVSAEPVAPGIAVRSAVNLVPWGQRYRAAAWLNAQLTFIVLRWVARRLLRPVVLWVYDPTAAPRASRHRWPLVYDCVDDYAEQTANARRHKTVAAADRDVATTAAVVFATAPELYRRQGARNPRTHHVPNAGDHRHFAVAADRSEAAPETQSLRRPVIGFSGNLLPLKVDFNLVGRVAQARLDWTFLLVGPVDESARQSLTDLETLPNVVWLGPRSYADLPAYVAAFDVALIPYCSNAYTASCFPLKLYEYLAAEKAVVATGLPSLAGLEPDVVLAEGADGVVAALEHALDADTERDRARRAALAAENTWERRTERLLSLVAEELAHRP